MLEEKDSNQLKGIMDKLEQGVKNFFQSNKYAEYLKVISKFHNYSLNNTILICMQKPDASLVAGYKAWQSVFERQVLKGEKGIKILAPVSYKKVVLKDKIDTESGLPIRDSEGRIIKEKTEVKHIKFKVVNVFDISQTEGKEIPEMITTLEGNVEQFQDFLFVLGEVSPVPIGFENIAGTAHGYFHTVENRIAINQGESQMQTIKTLIHEIAHAKLHSMDNKESMQKNRQSKEVEAESVAYVVCQHFGIDTSEYSFGYIAGWSSGKDTKELKESLELIRETSSKFIDEIENKLQERYQMKERGNKVSVLDKLKESQKKLQEGKTKESKVLQRNEVVR